MKTHSATILWLLAATVILSLGGEAALAGSSGKSNLSYYKTSKGNKLALAAARAMASKDCKGKVQVSARRPNKEGGRVIYTCAKGEWSVIILFKRVPGAGLFPDRFDYAG